MTTENQTPERHPGHLGQAFERALDAFWNAAYQQGHEQRVNDDEERTAQKAENNLRQAIAALSPSVPSSQTLGQEECAALIDQMLSEPRFRDHDRSRMSLTIAARAIRRGRHLTAEEQLNNVLDWLDTPPPPQTREEPR